VTRTTMTKGAAAAGGGVAATTPASKKVSPSSGTPSSTTRAASSSSSSSLASEFPLDATVEVKLSQWEDDNNNKEGGDDDDNREGGGKVKVGKGGKGKAEGGANGSPRLLKGQVYCTDEISQTIVLTQAVKHSTLSHQVYCISRHAILDYTILSTATEPSTTTTNRHQPQQLQVQRKVLEQQEKRALRIAEEALQHINQKASPLGQAVFDRLLKACNEVVWRGQTIVVMHQIQVEPPYRVQDCKWLAGKEEGDASSMERIRKIVGHTTTANAK